MIIQRRIQEDFEGFVELAPFISEGDARFFNLETTLNYEGEFGDMRSRVETICQKHSGQPCIGKKGSTDCNIPVSMGIPAISVGSYLGDGAHTREERVLISSLPVGQKITAELILSYFEK